MVLIYDQKRQKRLRYNKIHRSVHWWAKRRREDHSSMVCSKASNVAFVTLDERVRRRKGRWRAEERERRARVWRREERDGVAERSKWGRGGELGFVCGKNVKSISIVWSLDRYLWYRFRVSNKIKFVFCFKFYEVGCKEQPNIKIGPHFNFNFFNFHFWIKNSLFIPLKYDIHNFK